MNVREWALPVYTILTELSVGALFILWSFRSFYGRRLGYIKFDRTIENILFIIVLTLCAGMLGAHFHLSKPFYSFLSILNFGSSWLSREIVFTLLLLIATGWLYYINDRGQKVWLQKLVLGWVAIGLGIVTIYCMARIYMLPTQIAWNTRFTVVSFYLTALLLGFAALPCLFAMDLKYSEIRYPEKAKEQEATIQVMLPWFAAGAGVIAAASIAERFQQFVFWQRSNDPTAMVSIRLLTNVYPVLYGLHLILILGGVAGLLLLVFWQMKKHRPVGDILIPAYIICLLVTVGEILGRFLFYAAHVRIGI